MMKWTIFLWLSHIIIFKLNSQVPKIIVAFSSKNFLSVDSKFVKFTIDKWRQRYVTQLIV